MPFVAVCKLGDYLIALDQHGQVSVYDEATRHRRQGPISEQSGYASMCKGRGGEEMFFARGKEVECWRLEEGGFERVRSALTREKVNHLLALDHCSVLAV